MKNSEIKQENLIMYRFLLEHDQGTETININVIHNGEISTEENRLATAIKALRQHRPFETYRIINLWGEHKK